MSPERLAEIRGLIDEWADGRGEYDDEVVAGWLGDLLTTRDEAVRERDEARRMVAGGDIAIDALLASSHRLAWTSEPPTEPGWWWWKMMLEHGEWIGPCPVFCYEVSGRLWFMRGLTAHTVEDGGQWSSGPIPMPVDKEPG